VKATSVSVRLRIFLFAFKIPNTDAPYSKASQGQPKRKAPTSTKTQPKWQKVAPSSPPHPVPQIEADSADATMQTIDPFDQGTSSTVVPE